MISRNIFQVRENFCFFPHCGTDKIHQNEFIILVWFPPSTRFFPHFFLVGKQLSMTWFWIELLLWEMNFSFPFENAVWIFKNVSVTDFTFKTDGKFLPNCRMWWRKIAIEDNLSDYHTVWRFMGLDGDCWQLDGLDFGEGSCLKKK